MWAFNIRTLEAAIKWLSILLPYQHGEKAFQMRVCIMRLKENRNWLYRDQKCRERWPAVYNKD